MMPRSTMRRLLSPKGFFPVKSADRALEILELLAKKPSLRLTEISGELSFPVSSTHGLLTTLLEREYVTYNSAERVFSLGPRVLHLGSAYLGRLELVKVVEGVVQRLVAQCDETVHVAVLSGQNVIYVAKEESSQSLRLASAVGKALPAHGTGVGKVLLASLNDAALDALYLDKKLPSLTKNTITSLAALKRELEVVRARGYAHDFEESTEGLQCFAAPIRDASGRLVAAISVAVPTARLSRPRSAEHLISLVKEGADEISRGLGWAGESGSRGRVGGVVGNRKVFPPLGGRVDRERV